jgi:hypothetical protein
LAGLFVQNSGDFSKADLRHHWPDQLLSMEIRVKVVKTPIHHYQSSGTGLTGISMEQVKKLATFHF